MGFNPLIQIPYTLESLFQLIGDFVVEEEIGIDILTPSIKQIPLERIFECI